jgi:chromosome segregation ATPase
MSRIDEIKARLEECHSKEPEKWCPETRSYYYPKWDAFTHHAPDDIAFLLGKLQETEAAVSSSEAKLKEVEREVERLTEQLSDCGALYEGAKETWKEKVKLEAECDRYRAALEEVAEHKPDTWAGERAREALKNE